jgi:hypothetical protein
MKIVHCTVLSAIIVLTVLTGSCMTLATGIRTMRAGRATEQSDNQTELNDSPSGHYPDASTVDSGGSDLSTLHSDEQTLESDNVNQDLSALQSDAATVTNLGGTRTQTRPRRSPRARMPCLASRRARANTNGNSIDSQAHRIDSERNPSAAANEPGFPVLRRGSNGYYLR